MVIYTRLPGEAHGSRSDHPSQANETPPQRLLRSIGAVLAGFVVIAVLSLATDQLFHTLDVYPPWGQPMHDPR